MIKSTMGKDMLAGYWQTNIGPLFMSKKNIGPLDVNIIYREHQLSTSHVHIVMEKKSNTPRKWTLLKQLPLILSKDIPHTPLSMQQGQPTSPPRQRERKLLRNT